VGVVVFHSLRNTFCTLVDQAGATPAEGQALARHASLQLTYGIYTQTREERLRMPAEKAGSLFFEVPESTIIAQRKTAGLESSCRGNGYMVGVRGFEPPVFLL
jgi:hypothetical protein